MVEETARRGPEIEEEPKGSVVLGILGAVLGALVGAVPWFLASAFTSFFIGYLGFLIGWAAAFGYGRFHGRRSYGLAMTTVVICSVLALVLADFASNMFSLCTDADWQAAARYYGVSVAELAFVSLIDRENLHVILPNLIMGLLIGLLGVVSCKQYVRHYTQSGEVGRKPTPDPNSAIAMANAQANATRWAQPASTGLELPRQFTIRSFKANKGAGIAALVFGGLLLLFTIYFVGTGTDGAPVMLILDLVLLVEGTVLFLRGKNQRLEVDGDRLCAYTTFNKATAFHASEITGVTMPSVMTGSCKLYGKNDEVLFKYNNKAQNLPLLMQYLAEHNVPLKG